MKIGPVSTNLPASLVEFCRMQRMIAAGKVVGDDNGSGDGSEVSSHSLWVNRLSKLQQVRTDKVDRVRTDLQMGTYDTSGKLDTALDRLIDDLPLDDLESRVTHQRPM